MRREGFRRQERRRRPRGQGLRREKRWRWPQRQGWPGRQDAQGPWSWQRGKGRVRHEGREQGDRGAAQARRRLHHQGQGGPALHQEHGRRVVRLRREEHLRQSQGIYFTPYLCHAMASYQQRTNLFYSLFCNLFNYRVYDHVNEAGI
uniref:Uncharacterized protein n=1 Tax=Triticum urartu TaxID=4572 RepID=A0A8R7QWS1_TRIUA